MRSALDFCAGPAALGGVAPPVARAADAPSVMWLGAARRAMGAGDARAALVAFDTALAYAPDLAIARLGRAVCLAQLGRDAEAQAAILALLEASEGQPEALYQLARMCAREGRAAFGMPLLRAAVAEDPSLRRRASADPLFADHPAFLAVVGRL